jgi:hypothetical protein
VTNDGYDPTESAANCVNERLQLRLITEQEFFDYFSDLFWRAFHARPFDALCALLRPSGMQDAHWDPFEESFEAFEDYNALMRYSRRELSEGAAWRLGLLMYCQAVEMTAPQEFLANLLRALVGSKYHVKPFGSLGRSRKNQPFSWIPPSAPMKYRELKKLADAAGETALTNYIDQFFDEDVRNAFSHSDYILAPEHFRWTESGVAQQMHLDQLNILVTNCFHFFSTLLGLHKMLLRDLVQLPRYHKWPQYEVLELLSNEAGLYGFRVHFSNGAKATYARTPDGVDCTNVIFDSDGSINFMVGLLDDLRAVWLIDGRPYDHVVGGK